MVNLKFKLTFIRVIANKVDARVQFEFLNSLGLLLLFNEYFVKGDYSRFVEFGVNFNLVILVNIFGVNVHAGFLDHHIDVKVQV